MKSWLAVSFGEVVDRERKHPGERASGNLDASRNEAFGISGAWVPGRKVARAFLGRLTLGLGPIEAIGLGRLARGTEPRPMVPTMPPFFLPRMEIIPGRKKKKDKLDRHIMGNSRQSMLFNFNVNFVTFLKLH